MQKDREKKKQKESYEDLTHGVQNTHDLTYRNKTTSKNRLVVS